MQGILKAILIATVAVLGGLSAVVPTAVFASETSVNAPNVEVALPVNTGQTPTSWQFRSVWSPTYSPGYTSAPYAFLKVKKGASFNADLICMVNGGELWPAEYIGNDWYRCGTWYSTVTQIGITAKDTSGANDPARTEYSVYASQNDLQQNNMVHTLPSLAVVFSDNADYVPGPSYAADFVPYLPNNEVVRHVEDLDFGGVYAFDDPQLDYFYVIAHVTATSSPLGTFTNEYAMPIDRLAVGATSTIHAIPGTYPDGEYWVTWYFADQYKQKFNDTMVGPIDFTIADASTINDNITIPPDDGFSGTVYNPAPTSTAPVYCAEGALWEQWYCALKGGVTESVRFLFMPGEKSQEAVNSIWGMIKTTFPISWIVELKRIVVDEPAAEEVDFTVSLPMPTGQGNATSSVEIFALSNVVELVGNDRVSGFRDFLAMVEWLGFATYIFYRFKPKLDFNA